MIKCNWQTRSDQKKTCRCRPTYLAPLIVELTCRCCGSGHSSRDRVFPSRNYSCLILQANRPMRAAVTPIGQSLPMRRGQARSLLARHPCPNSHVSRLSLNGYNPLHTAEPQRETPSKLQRPSDTRQKTLQGMSCAVRNSTYNTFLQCYQRPNC